MDVRLCNSESDWKAEDEFCRKLYNLVDAVAGSKTDQQLKGKTKNPYSRGPSPTAIAIHEGRIVGRLTSTPHSLWIDGRERFAYWLSGFHVLPEARGKGVAKKLVACLSEELPLLSTVPVVEPSLRAFKANNWIFPGRIADYIHIVNPQSFMSLITADRMDRFLPAKLKPVAGILLWFLRKPLEYTIRWANRMRRIPSKVVRGKDYPFVDVDSFGADVDELWENTKASFKLTEVRNVQYMNWQFPSSKGWKKMIYTTHAGVKAWAIYAVMTYEDGGPLDGLVTLNVIDALWCNDEDGVLEKLVHHILSRAYAGRVDMVMFSGNNPYLTRVLRKSAFFGIPPTVHVGFYSQNEADDFNQLFAESYLTRGFTEAAGNLGPK